MRIIYPKTPNPNKEEVINHREILPDALMVLCEPPATWAKYPDTKQGALSILEMEYKEFIQAKSMHELYHIIAAAVNVYKYLKNEMLENLGK